MTELKKELEDKLQTANYNLWQNLLGLNVLLATIFVTIATFSHLPTFSKWIVYVGLLVSTSICFYLVASFFGTKKLYQRRLNNLTSRRHDKKNEEENEIAENTVYTLNAKTEEISIWGSFFGWVLLLCIMFFRLMIP